MIDRIALITGINGQDGSYLAELLLADGYQVYGTTRDPGARPGPNIAHIGRKVNLIYCSYELALLIDVLRQVKPDEVYNFAGQTYVAKSWDMFDDTMAGSAILPCNILEAIVRVDKDIRFFQASSCEMYSLDWENAVIEASCLAPGTPYGCAKAFAHNMVACYRYNRSIYAVSGILFHHESPRRDENFASRKIVKRAVAIKLGRESELTLGNIAVARDWGFAPDVVAAINMMMRRANPEDFVICSGETHSLQEVIDTVFALVGLDPRNHLRIDKSLFRAAEPPIIRGSSAKAKAVLGWQPRTSFPRMLEKMVAYEMALQTGASRNFADERPFG